MSNIAVSRLLVIFYTAEGKSNVYLLAWLMAIQKDNKNLVKSLVDTFINIQTNLNQFWDIKIMMTLENALNPCPWS